MKVLTVNSIDKVDTTRYTEGDVFLEPGKVGILHNGKVEPLVRLTDLKDYVKKKDVQKLINDTLKKVNKDG